MHWQSESRPDPAAYWTGQRPAGSAGRKRLQAAKIVHSPMTSLEGYVPVSVHQNVVANLQNQLAIEQRARENLERDRENLANQLERLRLRDQAFYTGTTHLDRNFRNWNDLMFIFPVLQLCNLSSKIFHIFPSGVKAKVMILKRLRTFLFTGIFFAVVGSIVFHVLYDKKFIGLGWKCFLVALCGLISTWLSAVLDEKSWLVWISYSLLAIAAILFISYQYLHVFHPTKDSNAIKYNSTQTESWKEETPHSDSFSVRLTGWCLDGSIPILCYLRFICPNCWCACLDFISWFQSIQWAVLDPGLPRRFWRYSFRRGVSFNYGTIPSPVPLNDVL